MDGTIDPSLLTLLPLLHSVFNGATTPQIPSSDPLIASVDASQDVGSPTLPCPDFTANALFDLNATSQQDGLVLNSIEALCAPPSDAPMLDTPLSGRAKIPKEAKTILDAHFVQNPYPKPLEISALADQLLLKPSTVKNWFGNARVRKLKERKLPSPPPPQEILDNLPLKRYLSCTPDDEAVSSYAIEANIRAAELEQNERDAKRKRAVTPVSITMDVAVDYDFRKDTPTPQDLPTNQFAYSSYSRYTTPPLLLPLTPSPPRSRASSQSSASSAGSFHNLVAPPNAHRGSRRGQKRWVAERPEASSGGTVNFCCTFPGCGRDFAQKSDWVRHEESIHVPQRIWICCKTSVSEAHASIKSMRIKRDMYPFMVHQRIQGCENKPPSHRTFLRKDQFLAHVRKCHKPKDDMLKLGSAKWLNIVAAHWSEELTYPSDHSSRRCELCDLSFTSWDERTSHFVDHFKSGVLIWKTKHLAETEGTVFIPPRLPGIL
ncbi:hypothetical protein B0J11DRAFT_584260 [Dendryphion nanum]|uniref:Uncharacterized protein n=1 Tax=Dendryphion nanum TaxID=256645 RepID=A0A9P9DBR2_9PLEO|nr:hypothetical protein B0J11DRAFT_584260 [Dendryphion nanum]